MKVMPLPFEELQGKGVLDFASESDTFSQFHHQRSQKWSSRKDNCYVGAEPTSVLDARRSRSPPTTTTSTLSSSLDGSGGNGGAGSTGTTAAASENPPALDKCGLGMEDWDSVLSESPGQEQSILKLIMGDMDDSSMGLNKLLQSGGGSQPESEFNGNFAAVDQGFSVESRANLVSSNIDSFLQGPSVSDVNFQCSNIQSNNARFASSPTFSGSAPNLFPVTLSPAVFQHPEQQQFVDEKHQIFNPPALLNQNQAHFTQNPTMFLPSTYAQLQQHQLLPPPPGKRLNSGAIGLNYQVPKVPFPDPGQELFVRREQHQQQVQSLPHHLQQRPTMSVSKQRMMGDDLVSQQLQQGTINQLFKAAELIEAGNPVLAQGILARLNQQLSPMGKPFQRATFYFKEALQLLLHMNSSNSSSPLSPFSLIFKIEAYKAFSEISPILQFANFTCNQVLLEAVEGFDGVHIIDFDIGYGGQWASFMQELALTNCGASSLKITAFVSPSTHDEFELSFTRENLKHFASELNLAFELEIVSLESLNSGSWLPPHHLSENETTAVNLPASSLSNYPMPLPLVLRFVKQLSPKIVVSMDRGIDRTDSPFPHHVISALQSYSALLESLEAVNVNSDALQKIERYLVQPGIEKIVLGRHRSPERSPPWRTLFLSSGFSPLTFSNFAESQAEFLVQRTPVRGFHIEKRQASLVLCWQRKELVSASAWRC